MADGVGNKAGKLLVWALLALLIVGLAGFGIGSFGGSTTTVGSVGDEEITAQEYFRALNAAARAEQAQTGKPLTLPEAQAAGIPARVRGQLVGAKALDGEAARLGLSVGDAVVADQITGLPAFQGPNGGFDRDAYQFTLRQNGWSVPDFEDSIRGETARTLLQGAVAGGVPAPDTLVGVLMAHYGERRTLSWVRFGPEGLAGPVAQPSEADITAYYDAHSDAFTQPETRVITYAWLSPDMLADSVTVDEDAVRALYDERIDEFVQPERRLVERLVFPDEAAATAAKAAIDAGETTFGALVEERGLSLEDVDLGEVARGDLGAAADGVFALQEPGIAGPLASDLGPALFRVNAVLQASEIPFDEVRDDLAEEAARDAAARQIEAETADFDDRLAAGATLEDLAAETDMELGTVDWYPGVTDGIAAYEGFRAAAETLTEDDFPQIALLDDGSAYAMRLDEIRAPRLRPLDEVRAEARAGAAGELLIAALRQQAEIARTTAAATGGLESVGTVETAEGVTRDGFLSGTPPALLQRAFVLPEGALEIVDGPEAVYLLRVDAVEGPAEDDARTAILRQAITAQLAQATASDVLTLYARALTAQAGIRFDEAGLNAVHSQVFR